MLQSPRSLARGVFAAVDRQLNRLYGWKYNPIYQSGALCVAMLVVLIATGTYLLIFYRIGSPYASVEGIASQAWTGRWIRGMHRFSADVALVAAFIHALRMMVQGRSWGPRALAWTSGLFLVFVFFVCGWTGYVLVWDTHGQILAAEGARLLDMLPIFSEPISRTFVGERPMPNAFFFINFFLHVALPLGIGLLLWIHVARVARPQLLPPRALTWGTVGLLFLLAVLYPAGLDPEADLLRLPYRASLDIFYGFWLPVSATTGPAVMWAGFLAVAGGLLLVPRLTRPARDKVPPPSWVDERSCTGCEQCYHDCPYEAITMIERSDDRTGMVAHVDPSLCVSCGICAGSCAPMVVGPPGRTGRDQLAVVKERTEAQSPLGTIVMVGCDRSVARRISAADYPGTMLHPVSCAGSVHTSVIEYYIRAGAAGVLVISCPPRDCWNREGGKWVAQRMFEGREAELKERVDRDRVRLVYAAESEPEVLAKELADFRARLARKGLVEGEDDIDLLALCDRAPEGAEVISSEELAR